MPSEDPPLFEVWANGQKKLDVRIPRRAFVFMEPFQARAAGGQLRIELKGPHGWILSGLVIGKEGPELAEACGTGSRHLLPDRAGVAELEGRQVDSANPPLELTPEEQERATWCFPRTTRSRLCRRTFRRGRRSENR